MEYDPSNFQRKYFPVGKITIIMKSIKIIKFTNLCNLFFVKLKIIPTNNRNKNIFTGLK